MKVVKGPNEPTKTEAQGEAPFVQGTDGVMKYNLTPEEATEIRSLQAVVSKTKQRIADLELEKLSAARYIDSLRPRFEAFEKSIIEKYGDSATIDVQAGVVTIKKH
jgi:hypothetical protein